jgi:Domain of unknown function (DUF4037)
MVQVSGAQFARDFHWQVVAPILARHFPRLGHAAGRLGSGSDVLGFDDAMSRDHDWGARLTVLVDEGDRGAVPEAESLLERELPETFGGRPVRFAMTWSPALTHQVHVATVMDFAANRLGVDPRHGLSTLEWLCLTGHSVLETVGGPVFCDTTRELGELKALLSWYPADVDGFVRASSWHRLAQSLPFVGRTAETGQELQSRLICADLVTELIRLAFLVERRWIPYAKWRETAFERLPIAAALRPHLRAAMDGATWREREDGLSRAAEVLGGRVIPFYDRPYRTVEGDVTSRLNLPLVGAIEQWVNSPEILARPEHRPAVIAAYQTWLGGAIGRHEHAGRRGHRLDQPQAGVGDALLEQPHPGTQNKWMDH